MLGVSVGVSMGVSVAVSVQLAFSDLICKEHHDGVASRSRRCVFHSKRVIVVLDDVEVDVYLSWPDHAHRTLYPNTHITCTNISTTFTSHQIRFSH